MYQAIEAVSRAGVIVPLEPVQFEEEEHLLILRLPKNLPQTPRGGARGAMKGKLSTVDEFIAAKAQEIAMEDKA